MRRARLRFGPIRDPARRRLVALAEDHPSIGNYGIYYNVTPFGAGVVEEWVYNFGLTRVMPSLIFENGVLSAIRYHGYGQ